MLRRLLLGITGSVAAAVIPQYILFFKQTLSEEIRVMMSAAACSFMKPYTLRLFSGSWVFTDAFSPNGTTVVPHIELTSDADVFLIIPATANILAKGAAAIADDLISTSILACPSPVIFVPSMNAQMWNNKGVQRNVARLKELGYFVVPPETGLEIATMRNTLGAIPGPAAIVDFVKTVVGESNFVTPRETYEK